LLDVGAHDGAFTLPFAALPDSRVLAFEPLPSAFARLEAALAPCPPHVTLRRAALGDAAGEITLAVPVVGARWRTTVAVTVVAPSAKVLPEAGLYATVAEQLSEAVAANVTTAVQAPLAVFAVMFDGQVIEGAWLSTTVTVKVHVAVLPAASVAVAVTEFVGKATEITGAVA
jgi:FkbM family methyltransferase